MDPTWQDLALFVVVPWLVFFAGRFVHWRGRAQAAERALAYERSLDHGAPD